MEILFPAGSPEYVKAAKECGANAVYGGLKSWNCRNKATNFELGELEEAINYCHNNSLKFYLTLNTLMFDDEIEEIVKILKAMRYKPDAVIVADIGLIRGLRNELSEIDLHASTQFGVCNIEDAKLCEELGFKRIILARELTKNEINNISQNTNLEIEIFVWGSQCISFSGACYLGSLINGGTANRGKCITLCRDIYSTPNHNIGNFMYVTDLNCIKEIEGINNITSLKLEGRRRPIAELQKAVYTINGLIREGQSNGYIISEQIDKNKLFKNVNDRQMPVFRAEEDSSDPNDVFILLNDNNEPTAYANKQSLGAYYVYTEIKTDFDPKRYNISLDISQKNGVATNIMLLTHKGEAFYFKNNEYGEKQEVYRINFKLADKLNLYSIKYKKEHINQVVKISTTTLNEIENFLNEKYNERNNYEHDFKSIGIKSLCVETSNVNYVKELSKEITVIYDLKTVSDLINVDTAGFNDNVIFKLPFFNFNNVNMESIYCKFTNKMVMATKLSQIYKLNKVKTKKLFVDYLINVWNKSSLKYLKSLNVQGFCSSPELSLEKNREIFKDETVIHLVAGFPTCVYTRGCFKGCLNCPTCNDKTKDIHNHNRNIAFKIHCYKDHRTLTYDRPILNNISKCENNEMFRYIVGDEDIMTVKDTIKYLQEDNYYQKLQQIKFWENGFSNILEEDK